MSVKVKTGETVESIEHTRREGGDGVGTQASKMKMVEGRRFVERMEGTDMRDC